MISALVIHAPQVRGGCPSVAKVRRPYWYHLHFSQISCVNARFPRIPQSARSVVPEKPVSLTKAGHVTLEGCKVEFENAAITCLWKGGRSNRVVEEFALRMQKETGCVIADVGAYRVIDAGELAGLNGRRANIPPAVQRR